MLKFSIIIPFYQVPEKYFKQCLDSIMAQTYLNYELILISDGADENSLSVARKYKAIDDRIKIIEQKNQGVSTARNHGIDVSAGDWIMFIDADDWIEPDTLEKFSNYIFQTEADYIFGGFYKEFSNKQVKIYSQRYPDNKIFEGKSGRLKLQKMTLASPMYGDSGMRATMYRSVWGGVFSSSLLKDNNVRFDPSIKQDEDFLFRVYVAEHSKLTVYVNEMFYHYRSYGSSASVHFREDSINNFKETTKILKEYLIDNQIMDALIDDYNYRIIEISNSLALNYFFHADNMRSMQEKEANAKQFFNSSFFKDAFSYDLYRKLPLKRKVQVMLLKNNLFRVYRLLYGGYNALAQRNTYD